MNLRATAALILVPLLGACTDTTVRYVMEPAKSELRVRVPVKLLLVRTVSLPTYAAAEEIAIQGDDGTILAGSAGLWADDPERAVTLAVSRHLNQMTTATVAPDPWPLSEAPDSVVDIRVEQFLATNAGIVRLSGQYFLGGEEIPEPEPDYDQDPPPAPKSPRRTLRSSVQLFDIAVPIAGEDVSGISAAQAEALKVLSETIAKDIAN